MYQIVYLGAQCCGKFRIAFRIIGLGKQANRTLPILCDVISQNRQDACFFHDKDCEFIVLTQSMDIKISGFECSFFEQVDFLDRFS